MEAHRASSTITPHRVAGALLVVAALLTLTGVGLYFASGAVADDPGDPLVAGRALADANAMLPASAYVSIAANALFAIGAVMMAHAGRAADGHDVPTRLALPGLWATFVVAVLLIMPFDLALPRGLIPLAKADPGSPVFAAIYESINLTHSVGLFVFYASTTALFVHQSRTVGNARGRIGWRVGAFVSALAVVVAIGLIVERPPVFLVPAVFLAWLGLLVLGVRMMLPGSNASPSIS